MPQLIDKDSIIRSYNENADYDIDNDVGKAKLFRLACRRMLNPAVLEASRQNSADIVQYNLEMVQTQLEAVEKWIAANDPTKTARYGVSLMDFSTYLD